MTPSDLLRYKARHAWQAARLLADVHPDDAASRAYYAVFHAAKARLGRDPRHGELGSADVLVAAGLEPGDVPDLIALYEARRASDYSATRRISREEALALLATARRLLQRLRIPLD